VTGTAAAVALGLSQELSENILLNGAFSITLDAWTAINQKAYLGITM
jgi:hypothetical protein